MSGLKKRGPPQKARRGRVAKPWVPRFPFEDDVYGRVLRERRHLRDERSDPGDDRTE